MGLINKEVPEADTVMPAEPAAAEPAPEGNTEFDAKMVEDTMRSKVQPEFQKGFDQAIVAGMKVMFDPKTHELMLEELQGEGEMVDKLSNGIAGLMLVLDKESQKTLPPQVLAPAGVVLLAQAVDFINEAGIEEVTVDQYGQAVQLMIVALMRQYGVPKEQIAKIAQQAKAQAIQAAGSPEQPTEPQPGLIQKGAV